MIPGAVPTGRTTFPNRPAIDRLKDVGLAEQNN